MQTPSDDQPQPKGALPDQPGGRRAELLGWLLVLATLPLMGLTKQNAADIPWHLATARLAEAQGHWPTRNTFSWTFPNYTLYQQYPVFQGLAWALFKIGGWESLSLLLCTAMTTLFVLFVRAAGPFGKAAPFHPIWAMVAFSLQTRASLRPDLLSLTLLATYLLVLGSYRRRPAIIVVVPLLHWVWVNGHQLFPLSFLVQAAFIGHLLLARWRRLGLAREDAHLPLWPPVAALAASVALTFVNPIGTEVIHLFAHTAGSLRLHRNEVQELARIWSDPLWLAVALTVTVPTTIALIRSWRVVSPFEVGLWLVTLAIAWSAVRGLAYATLISAVVFQRTLLRHPLRWRPSPELRNAFRALAVAGSAVMSLAVLYHRWLHVQPAIGGSQAGIGRSVGDWPDAALATLKADPPPGRMMNLSWSFANGIIWGWPEQPVFVDPRFEAYPRGFLLDAMAARTSDQVLARLIARFRPGWMFIEHCSSPERDRVAFLAASGRWQVTYADVQTVVLVERTDATADYRARHPFAPVLDPPGLVTAPPGRRVRQRMCYARLLGALGLVTEARAQLAPARAEAAREPQLQAPVHALDEEIEARLQTR